MRGRRDEYTEATRQALLSAGRDAFSQEGFAGSGVEAISRAARVTRGAFYHHFEDKKALFDAVVVALQAEAAAAIADRARSRREVWDRLEAGIDAYLDACIEPAYGRIVVNEAPVVLGGQRYREIEEAYPMALLAATLTALERRGQLVCANVGLLCRLVDAMICKVALLLPQADDPVMLRRQAQEMIGQFLGGFRPA